MQEVDKEWLSKRYPKNNNKGFAEKVRDQQGGAFARG